MSRQPHKGFFISVEGVRDAVATFLLTPVIKISAAREGGAVVATLVSSEKFKLEKDVEAYGLHIGINWIDAHLEVAPKLRAKSTVLNPPMAFFCPRAGGRHS